MASGPNSQVATNLEQVPSQVEVSWQDPSDFAQEIAAIEDTPRETTSERDTLKYENADRSLVEEQKAKIDKLEAKLFELARSIERIDKPEPIGILQLRTTLRSLDISDSMINEVKKPSYGSMGLSF
jgi:hypothetical protein